MCVCVYVCVCVLVAMDHLYPVKYRAHLVGSKRQGENGLKKVHLHCGDRGS